MPTDDNPSAPDGATHPTVYYFDWRGEPGREMRVIIDEGMVTIEEMDGKDGLGVQRWSHVDMDTDEAGECMTVSEWAGVIALALHEGRRVGPEAEPHRYTVADIADMAAREGYELTPLREFGTIDEPDDDDGLSSRDSEPSR